MTHEPTETLTPAEARAREAVRSLSRPQADSAFRARLKREFEAGSITSPYARRGRRSSEQAPSWESGMGRVVRGRWARWAPLAWAAAAAFLIMSVIGLNRGPRWEVSGVTGAGIAVVDDRPIPLEHREQLLQALHPGARIQVPIGAELEVTAPGDLMIQATAGSEMVLPKSPGRWFGRQAVAEIRRGELRITTGSGFHGARLAVITPEARVEVTGTTLAVICEPRGTCVCVFEGRVLVGARSGTMEPVTSGRRRYVFKDGRPPEMAEMRGAEREKLGTFRGRLAR